MGDTSTPGGADHDYYRRPADGMEPQRSVQIVDDGSGSDAGAVPGAGRTGSGTAGSGGRARWDGAAGHDVPNQSPQDFEVPPRRRINYFFAAAWALVGLLLALGLSWLTGVFSEGQYFVVAPGAPNVDAPSAIVMNLYSMGPVPLLLGLFGAFTLLVVQGAAFQRNTK